MHRFPSFSVAVRRSAVGVIPTAEYAYRPVDDENLEPILALSVRFLVASVGIRGSGQCRLSDRPHREGQGVKGGHRSLSAKCLLGAMRVASSRLSARCDGLT